MNEYPTDEELELLISQLEKQELYAPRHMKEQILAKAFPEPSEAFSEQTAASFPEAGGRSQPVSTVTYRLKIIAGMAAALIMLMTIPITGDNREYGTDKQAADTKQWVMESQTGQEKEGVDVNERFCEQTRELNRKFNTWFEQLNSFQLGTLFDMKNGGIYDED